MTIKQGDNVYLKSGSPKMFVEEIVGENVKCSYLDDLNQHTLVQFNVACLIKTNPKEQV